MYLTCAFPFHFLQSCWSCSYALIMYSVLFYSSFGCVQSFWVFLETNILLISGCVNMTYSSFLFHSKFQVSFSEILFFMIFTPFFYFFVLNYILIMLFFPIYNMIWPKNLYTYRFYHSQSWEVISTLIWPVASYCLDLSDSYTDTCWMSPLLPNFVNSVNT